ncbi:cupin domain-containing protein [Pseudoduganella namucuonensis]|uniref:Cupin domain-containing protein n=1 Tax=Pseudoduganella namucuonensis TaxID=1035707 RepID=A0A1I7KCJ8_9BURK|nr:cupin domain-containing protein [Pseudoduganella namucuonensis]SFU95125.1 Cupin domain-containing protein [Pseudoduganella namucuonensis]
MKTFAESVDLAAAFGTVNELWSPKVIAQVNDQYVKLAKVQGEITWHSHEHEDELFYIVRGHLRIHYEDRVVDLPQGSLHVVPRGVQHKPVADEECWIMLIETVTTKHTGDVDMPYTKTLEQQLAG